MTSKQIINTQIESNNSTVAKKGRKTTKVESEPEETVAIDVEPPKKGRKTVAKTVDPEPEADVEPPKKGRKTVTKTVAVVEPEKTVAVVDVEPPKKGRKTVTKNVAVVEPVVDSEPVAVVEPPKKGRKTATKAKETEDVAKTKEQDDSSAADAEETTVKAKAPVKRGKKATTVEPTLNASASAAEESSVKEPVKKVRKPRASKNNSDSEEPKLSKSKNDDKASLEKASLEEILKEKKEQWIVVLKKIQQLASDKEILDKESRKLVDEIKDILNKICGNGPNGPNGPNVPSSSNNKILEKVNTQVGQKKIRFSDKSDDSDNNDSDDDSESDDEQPRNNIRTNIKPIKGLSSFNDDSDSDSEPKKQRARRTRVEPSDSDSD
jgi:hypothetical protein